jgi:hypothetical protein
VKGASLRLRWRGQGETSRLWLDLRDRVHSRRQPKGNIAMAVRVQASLSMSILADRETRVAAFDFESESNSLS